MFQHHDWRKKNIVYPKVDEVLSDERRKDLLARCGLVRR
jgi:hypothetical protein